MMTELSVLEALSGVFGSISLISWVFVLVPQLAENYRRKNAEGISLAFLLVWFLGDVSNLIGAVWARLVPTVTALALYFCLADAVLILQCFYYKQLNPRKEQFAVAPTQIPGDDPHQSLLNRDHPVIEPGSRRRRTSSFKDGSLPVLENDGDTSSSWTWNTVSVVSVCIAGAAVWVFAWKARLWTPTPRDNVGSVAHGPVGAMILGYLSAICYLGARLPQIVKNYREKSCEGLALLFFLLSLLGNATYGAAILLHSTSPQYVITNLPWLIGSIGTMGEDVLIFVQFRLYVRKAVDHVGSSAVG